MLKTIAAGLFCFCCLIPCFSFSQFGNEMLDSAFGTNGKVTTDVSENHYNNGSYVASVMVQKDGKIIVAGNSEFGVAYNMLLTRYLPDGKVDSSFSQDGIRHYLADTRASRLQEAHLQSNDKIIAVVATGGNFYLTRFLESGNIDTTFGANGITPLTYGSQALDIDDSDNIIVCGSKARGNLIVTLQRFYKNGKPDVSFGNNNLASVLIGHETFLDISPKVKFDNDKNIVAGCTWNPLSNFGMAILRFTPKGVLDSSFNRSGKLILGTTAQNRLLNSIAILPDNKIITAGTNQKDFLLAKIKSNGTIDSAFGKNGYVTTDFTFEFNHNRLDEATSVCVQTDNKIVVAGTTSANRFYASGLFALSRYLSNGSLDTSFGQQGKIVTDFGDDQDAEIQDITLQKNGKIVAAGYHATGDLSDIQTDIAVARYLKEKPSLSKQNNFIVRNLIRQQKADRIK